MAATRLIPLHVNKGKTIARCLAERTDYSQNGKKTKGGEYVSSYECDPETADQEFLLSKRQYEHITGRHQSRNIIAYQIRQSFKPGEVTPELANKIGFELAKRFTKGNHAFLVATHIDRAHIHNHIIFNSTTLDCTGKFKDFKRSWQAIRQISDILCLENGLSIIQPKPPAERKKRTDYPKTVTIRAYIRQAIDAALCQKPQTFEQLVSLLEQAGYSCRPGKVLSIRGKNQKRFVRLDTLGLGYSEKELRAALEGKTVRHHKSNLLQSTRQHMNLLIDLQSAMVTAKGPGYQRWAKVFNLKQMAQVLRFLQEQGIDDYTVLKERTEQASVEFDRLLVTIKQLEQQLNETSILKKHIINYAKTRTIYQQYRKAGYSKRFFEDHRKALTLHKAAKQAFSQLDGKIPRVKELNERYTEILVEKKKLYAKYRQLKEQTREYQIASKVAAMILEKEEKEVMQVHQQPEKTYER